MYLNINCTPTRSLMATCQPLRPAESLQPLHWVRHDGDPSQLVLAAYILTCLDHPGPFHPGPFHPGHGHPRHWLHLL